MDIHGHLWTNMDIFILPGMRLTHGRHSARQAIPAAIRGYRFKDYI